MKTKCPHCNTVQNAPDEALRREALCKSCREKFTITEYAPPAIAPLPDPPSPADLDDIPITIDAPPPNDRSDNILSRAWIGIPGPLNGDTLDNGTQQQNTPAPSPTDIKAFALRVVKCLPYVGVAVGCLSLWIESNLWGTQYTLGQLFHWYLLAVVGILCFAWILIRRHWKSRYILVVLWLLLSAYGLRTFAAHDYFVVFSKEEQDGLRYYNYYTRWSPRLIKTRISGNDITIEGPYACRPETPYQPQRHGLWTSVSIGRPLITSYNWYWYDTEISEGEWLHRTSR